jgi:putative ABC transport system permease protein
MKHEWRIPFFLILRHLRRGSKWTLALIIFLMAIAFINMVFATSLFNGIIATSDAHVINTYAGNITIYPNAEDDVIANTDRELEKIRAVDGVKAATAHYMLPASSMKYKNIKSTFRLLAINPKDEKQVTTVYQSITSGKYLDPDDKKGILLGSQVTGSKEAASRSLKGVRVGDTVKVTIQGTEYSFIVRGIFDSNYVETDFQTFITEKAMRDVAPYLRNQASSILVKVNTPGNEDSIIATLKARGVNGEMHNWKDSAGLMKNVSASFVSIDVILSLVATLIAAVTIFIVIYVDITNKRNQIGILRALGVRPYLIHAVYILQSAIYSIAGVLAGTIMFFGILVPYFIAHPFALPMGNAVLTINVANFLFRAETILWVALLSGLIPAVMVTRMNMLDEIRGK